MKIRSVEYFELCRGEDSAFLSPHLARLQHGAFAVLCGQLPRDAAQHGISPQSRAVMFTIDDHEDPAGAEPDLIPDSLGAGNAPQLFHLQDHNYLLIDSRWAFAPEDQKPRYGFRIPGVDGWVGYHGAFTREAAFKDGAWRFGPEQKITCTGHDFPVIFPGRDAVRHASGALLLPCYCAERKSQFDNRVFILRSEDFGATWSLHGDVDKREDKYAALHQAALLPLHGDNLLAMIRTTNQFDYMLSSISPDGGRTWPRPERTPVQGRPPRLLDIGGAAACLYALLPTATGAKNPGVHLCFSHDSGAWDTDNILTLTHGLDYENFMDPHALLVDSNTLLAVFAANPDNGPARLLIARAELDL